MSLVPGQGHFGPDAIPGVKPHAFKPSPCSLTRAHSHGLLVPSICGRTRAGVAARACRSRRRATRWCRSSWRSTRRWPTRPVKRAARVPLLPLHHYQQHRQASTDKQAPTSKQASTNPPPLPVCVRARASACVRVCVCVRACGARRPPRLIKKILWRRHSKYAQAETYAPPLGLPTK